MHSILFAFAATGLASLVSAYTAPGANTWGPLLTPDLNTPVTQGQTAAITWDPQGHPTDGVTVSLVLCHGPSTNCVPSTSAIVEGLPAAQKSYQWSVPSDLTPGTQSTDTGYGLLIIVDGTGEFQYSTQFSVLEGKGGSSGSGTTSSSSKPTGATTTTSTSGSVFSPPAQQTGSYTWTETPTGNGTHFTGTGSWGTTVTSVPTGSVTGTVTASIGGNGWASTVIGSTLTSVISAPGTSVVGATGSGTSSATGTGVSPSTFPGAADRLSLNVAGLAIAGAVAMFAL